MWGTPVKVVLIPGWHENAGDMRVFVDGRNGKPGLAALGFDCVLISEGRGDLQERIERFAQTLDGLKVSQPEAFPVATFGYSAGGLINRGFLRAHPDRAAEIAAVFQLATPNGGIALDSVALTLRALRIQAAAIEDMMSDSPFMAWLNQSGGRFEGRGRSRRWRFDVPPDIATNGIPILNAAGALPREFNDDGVVSVASATLDGLVPSCLIQGRSATHLNISGAWNALTFLFRGWRANDDYWPAVVERAAAFFRDRGHP